MLDHLFQLTIHAYYAGEPDAGRRACERLLSQQLPADIERQTRVNRTWYTRRLADLCPSTTVEQINLQPPREGWSLFNPSLLREPDGIWCLVRSSNYRIEGGKYVIPEADGNAIRTENLIWRVGDGLCKTITGPDYPQSEYPVHGLEDCRLRRTATGVGVSATCRNVHGWDGRCRIVTADLDLGTAKLFGLKVLESGDLQTHEKNWMPIEGRGGWLYAANHKGHTVTVDEDPALAGTYQIAQHQAAPQIASQFRGGSQLAEYRGGWLAVIHEAADTPDGRVYEHRFAWWDASLRLARVSEPFAFCEPRTIEFAAGLVVDGDTAVVSFGVNDATAWLARVNMGDVCAMLQSVS